MRHHRMCASNITSAATGVGQCNCIPTVTREEWKELQRHGYGEYRDGTPYALYPSPQGTTFGPVEISA